MTSTVAPTAEKRPLLQMQKAAEAIVERLRPACERIEVAGSIRRRAPWCKDVELVCIPRMGVQQAGLFDTEEVNELDGLVASQPCFKPRLDKNGRPAMGPRYKRLLFNWEQRLHIPLDLFSVIRPASWGVILAVRTGPADFSHRLVTRREHGGMLPDRMHVRNGGLWKDEMPPWQISCPEERDFFEAIGFDLIEPWDRK